MDKYSTITKSEKLFALSRNVGTHTIRLLPNWQDPSKMWVSMTTYLDYVGEKCSKEDYMFLKSHGEKCSMQRRYFACALVNGEPKMLLFGRTFYNSIMEFFNRKENLFDLRSDISLRVNVSPDRVHSYLNIVSIVDTIKSEKNVIWTDGQPREPVLESLKMNFPDGLSIL